MKKLRIFILFIVIVSLFTGCKKKQQENSQEPETEGCLKTVKQENAKEPERKKLIFVTKGDNVILDEKNNEEIKAISGVTGTEFYGGAARVSYFYREEKDYTIENTNINPEYPYDHNPQMINGETCQRYIISAESLTEDNLSAGVLPKGMDEIVLYSSDESVIGKSLKMYFCNYYDLSENRFEEGYIGSYMGNMDFSFIAKEMKITGIIKEQTTQVYFSDSFCDMMNKAMDIMYPFIGTQCFENGEYSGVQKLDGEVGPDGKYKIVDFFYYGLPWKEDYDYIPITKMIGGDNVLVYVDEKLGEQEVGISKYWIQNKIYTGEKYEQKNGIYNLISVTYHAQWRHKPDGIKVPESEELWEDTLSAIGYTYYVEDSVSLTGIITDYGEIIQKISDTWTESGDYTLAVNEKLFERIYPYDGTKIIAVYAEQGKEAQVMETLREQGYEEYKLPKVIWFEIHTEEAG